MKVVVESVSRSLTKVSLGSVTMWFSYSTCVAFETPKTGRVVSENQWSRTTGKHLNMLAGPEDRTKGATFNSMLADLDERVVNAVWQAMP